MTLYKIQSAPLTCLLVWPRPRCQLGRGHGFVSRSPGNCAPPVYLTLAQVLQAISPAPQELPKESRMNSPFPDTKTRACPGSQRLGLFAAEESWAPEPEATPSSNCWATLCLACPCDHGASHPTTPCSPATSLVLPPLAHVTPSAFLGLPDVPAQSPSRAWYPQPLAQRWGAAPRLIYGPALPLWSSAGLCCASALVRRPHGLLATVSCYVLPKAPPPMTTGRQAHDAW